MASDSDQSDRALLRNAYVAIQKLQAQVQGLERARHEPIAVVGMACRFPGGGDHPEAYWEFISRGGDAVREVPSERWDLDVWSDPDPDAPGKSYSRVGAFLDNVDCFDAPLFGIAPREAASLDPQQGLLLETAWEAFEDAGLAADRLDGSITGVFVGLCNSDFARAVTLERGDESLDAYTGTGTSAAAAAGRISYVFGLRGPSLAIDTACSSSLVAIHEACQALRSGECRQALAGGVNLLFDPRVNVVHAKARMLSPSGRCRAFDASADGFVRGEGCGLVVLKRLVDAIDDGDRVLAVIRGSAVNQDGRSSGLTAPNGPSQQDVMRKALSQAGVDPATVDYVEAHGTGTALGDPIEADALQAVYGVGRSAENPLWIGSVKTNIGHLEAAAGVAGLIKVILAIRHGQLPPHLHLDSPSPNIPWQRMALRVCRDGAPWVAQARPRLAGISSFGFSGTNAHLLVEEAPRPLVASQAERTRRTCHLLALSAAQPAALRSLAECYAAWLEARPELDPADFAFTANTGRSHLGYRAAIVFSSREELLARLRQLAAGGAPQIPQGRAVHEPRVAFLFTGQGSQYAGMAKRFYETQPVFREALDRSAAVLSLELPRPLLEVLFESGEALNETVYTQPALFAVETALLGLWRSLGIEPETVLGHSVGEYAAACAAGVFDTEEGLRLIAARGRLMQSLPGGGAMAAIQADAGRVTPFLEQSVSLAADNGAQITIAGPAAAVDRTIARLKAAGIAGQRLPVSHAFHSVLMEPILDALAEIAAAVEFRPPAKRLIANLVGRPLEHGELLDAAYWRRHAREPVQFGASIQSLAGLECDTLLELGPSPVLIALAQRAWPAQAKRPAMFASLRPGRAADELLAEALAALYAQGAAPDWAAWDRPWSRSRVPLPAYPFQRMHYVTQPPPRPQPRNHLRPDAYFYEIEWQPLARPVAARSDASSPFLILGSRPDLARAIAAQRADSRVVPTSANACAMDWDQVLAADPARPWAGVLYLAAAEAGAAPTPVLAERLAGELIELIQALGRLESPTRVWIVTAGAQAVRAEDPVAPDQAALWGLGRAALGELPWLVGGLIDLPRLDAVPIPEIASALWSHIDAAEHEDQIALRSSANETNRYGARLLPRRSGPSPASATGVRSGGRYLITGGLGALGLHIAHWLAEQGATSLVLLGRRAAHEGAVIDQLARLRERGTEVRLACADVSDHAQLEAALAEHWPLAGIFHAAGISVTSPLDQITRESLHATFAAKVEGAWNLHALSLDRPLDIFVCLSSVAAVWGGRGQAHYAAANAFLDGLVRHRRELGLAGLSVDYGPWQDSGMVTGEARDWLERAGLRPMAPQVAVSGLAALLAAQARQTVMVDADWARFLAVYQVRRRSPLLSQIEAELASAAPLSTAASATQSDAIAVEGRRQWIEERVDRTLAQVLRMAVDTLDPVCGFFDMGMDSLTAVEFAQALGHRLGRALPNTLAMDHPNRAALVDHLMRAVFGGDVSPDRGPSVVATDEAIAIVGMACRFPGADDPDAYWRLLEGGVDAIREVPPERWDIEAYYDPDPAAPGKMYVRHGGFLDQIDQFDAGLFRITPREAMGLDPQQRLLLETAWEALRNAGQSPEALRGSCSGVYVGVGANEYGQLTAMGGAEALDAYFGTGNALNVVAGRCAYVLGFQGPAVALDTACSSSLVAVHQALLGLRAGDCDLALAGGVSLMVSPLGTVAACRARMLAADGRCKTFDEAANGYVRGEGCGVVVLKRLADARRDGDRVLALVRGSAVNHDGASSGLTVPNGPAQEALLRQALARAGVRPADVAYVEAHGTGTALGDPIEVQALGAVFAEGRQATSPLWIGSAKSQIGHLEAAAGIAGLIKVVLALHYGRLPGQLHFRNPNPHIPWSALPVRVAERPTDWPEGRRVAGVSSFGFSGTNAHVVLEGVGGGAAAPIAATGPYPFRRERYWIETPSARTSQAPLLGTRRVSALSGEAVHQARWDCATHSFIAEHRVYGEILVPGATYAAMGLSIAGMPGRVIDLSFDEPMLFSADEERLVQLVVANPGEKESTEFEVFSSGDGEAGPWIRHAHGRAQKLQRSAVLPGAVVPLCELKSSLEPVPADSVFDGLSAVGVELGPRFRAIRAVWRGEDHALARLEAPAALSELAGELVVHPALLDACTQAVGAARAPSAADLFVPWRYESVELYEALPESFYCHARLRPAASEDRESAIADLQFMDEAGRPLGGLRGLVLKRAPRKVLLRRQRATVDDLFYGLRWSQAPLLGSAFADTPTLTAEIANVDPASVLPVEPVWSRFQELVRSLEPLALAWTLRALSELGWQPRPGETVHATALVRQLGIDPRHVRLTHRLLQCLAEEGTLEHGRNGWIVQRPLLLHDPRVLQGEIEQSAGLELPGGGPELALLGRCGERLAATLRGEIDPLSILFPPDGRGGAEAIYRDGLGAQVLGREMREVVAAAAARLPTGHPLRVLEIGAGTGGATAHILDALPAGSSYCYTDLSPAFFPAARARFSAWPGIEFRTLDIERDPWEQGLLPMAYDLVVAANVLHATRDLDRTLSNVAGLIAPGGLCLVLEGVQRRCWLDITFGLLPGWWRFEDARRADYPLLERDAWRTALSAHGLTDMVAVSAAGEAEQSVMLARRATGESAASQTEEGAWLIFMDAGAVGEGLSQRISATRRVTVTEGRAFAEVGEDRYVLPRGDREACARLLEQIAARGTILRHVAYLWGLDVAGDETAPAELPGRIHEACSDLLAVVQALAGNTPASFRGLSIVTRGAQALESGPSIAQAALLGLGLGIATEYPELRCRRIDLDPEGSASEGAQLWDELNATDGEDQVAWRGSQRRVARLTRLAAPPRSAAALELDAERSYLITGGLGGLGLEVAGWMVQRGARNLMLVGRSVPDDAAAAVLQRLREAGCEVRVMQGDVADEGQLRSVLEEMRRSLPPLHGVVHAAGQLHDAALPNQSARSFADVLAAKVAGAWNLHRLTWGDALGEFVLFSSSVALLGSWGQANHAAANAFLDALAHYRRFLGLPAISIDWGPWARIGAAARGGVEARVAGHGLGVLEPEEGTAALERCLIESPAQAAVIRVDWARLANDVRRRQAPPLLQDLLRQVRDVVADERGDRGDLLRHLQTLAAEEAEKALVTRIQHEVARVLRLGATTRPDPQRGWFDLGMDSLVIVELVHWLQDELGDVCRLPSTVAFDLPTISDLARHVVRELRKSDARTERGARAERLEQRPDGGEELRGLSLDELVAQLDQQIADATAETRVSP